MLVLVFLTLDGKIQNLLKHLDISKVQYKWKHLFRVLFIERMEPTL